jgi:hypothetical protein
MKTLRTVCNPHWHRPQAIRTDTKGAKLRRLSIVAVLSSIGVMAAAPAAQAAIVIDQGVDDVKIGDTEAQVEIGSQSALTASAKSANTLIVVNKGIGGVDIGQTARQVQREAGKPTSKSTAAKSWYYDTTPPYAQVGFGNNKRVNLISPNSTRDKTSKGIGEGSSEAQVRAAYPNAICDPQPGPGGTRDLSCGITKKLSGGKTVETSFTFSTLDGGGGVNSVYITEF